MICTILPALPLLLAGAPPLTPATQEAISISADVVYTAAGEPIEGGLVVVGDGKIRAVGKGTGDEGLHVAAITPGLVDLGAWMNAGVHSTEHATEIPVNLRVIDSLDPFSKRWDRELRSGVTSLLAAADDNSVVGGLAVLIKTGGGPDLEARTVVADAVLRGAIGTAPSRYNSPSRGGPGTHFVRRPTTRMGVEWVWRKAFYDALASKSDPSRDFEGAGQFLAVLAGERPLMIGAATTQDIRTALFLKREFGIPELIVQNAAEAWKEPRLIRESGASFVLPPYSWGGRVNPDNAFHAWSTAAELHAAGVTFALSGRGASEMEDRLALQPAYAMRGGLSFDAALAAVTITPARMLGAADRIGSIEAGKDADLVLWSGTPFEPTSRVIGVVLDGELVVDPRN